VRLLEPLDGAHRIASFNSRSLEYPCEARIIAYTMRENGARAFGYNALVEHMLRNRRRES
jgi:hypothetical protein